jgi:hypothetical protein
MATGKPVRDAETEAIKAVQRSLDRRGQGGC